MENKEVTKKLDNHEDRIQVLEKADVQMAEQIKTLITKMDGLIGWIKAFVILGASSLLGFFFWYIQSLG
ncbi:MAG: hypothetical protein FH753_01060 [Firmicutes bacterium]|nr:hypothetical protein [Bacillota bacterium]